MACFLALDVGGTKTDYALVDETQTLARVRTATIKRMRADAASATARLDEALEELTRRTGVPMHSIERTCVGTAGNTVPLVTDWLRAAIRSRVAGELVLVGDVEIALDAAFHGGPGVLMLAGTGSNCAGRTAQGTLLGAGGYGPVLADQGSGHRIGTEALRAAFLAKDEGRDSTLLEAVRAFWQLPSEDHLVEYANSMPAPDFSRLTELVLLHAERGDAVAAAVLQKEGEDLGYLARLMVRRLRAASADPDGGAGGTAGERFQEAWPAVAFAGSILEKVLPVRSALIAAVQTEFPAVQYLDGVIDPLEGAVWRARQTDPLRPE